jgi:hypothetical protein
VLKGVEYKSGKVVSMLISSADTSSAKSSANRQELGGSKPTSQFRSQSTESKSISSDSPSLNNGSAATESRETPEPGLPINTAKSCPKEEIISETTSQRVPKFTIVERGEVLLSDYIPSPAGREHGPPSRPRDLVVRISLPLVVRVCLCDVV